MSVYVTLNEFKAWLSALTEGVHAAYTSGDDAFLQSMLDAAEDVLHTTTNRRFVASTATRYYYSGDVAYTDLLLLDDDLLTVTSIKHYNGAITLASTDYVLLPRNATPKARIRLLSGGWQPVIEVTGTWGYSATPSSEVKHLVQRIAYTLWQRRHAIGEAQLLGERILTSAVLPDDIQYTMNKYKRSLLI